MSSDEPPPRPGRTTRCLALLIAVLALAGVVLAVAGADTTVTDTAGSAPIVDDASRHDPVTVESSQETAVEGPSEELGEGLGAPTDRCRPAGAAPRTSLGCGPPTLRGPPGA